MSQPQPVSILHALFFVKVYFRIIDNRTFHILFQSDDIILDGAALVVTRFPGVDTITYPLVSPIIL